jgi:ribosomal protein S18 acetylase RimI-like enzyme
VPGSYDCPVQTHLRAATAEDSAGVLALWQEAAEPTSTDSADALGNLLRRDPGALIVAEAGGRIVGSVIAGWDGWRGAVYRLAVAPDHRRRGLGQALLRAAEERLTELGGRRLHAIVVESNADAVAFWTATDWEHQAGQLRFAKSW